MQTRSKARRTYTCQDCGKSDGLNKNSHVCPACGGSVSATNAQPKAKAKAAEQAKPKLSAEAQAVVEILAGIPNTTRKDARDAVARLIGEGRMPAELVDVATKVGASKNLDRPIGYFITLARRGPDKQAHRTEADGARASGWADMENLDPAGPAKTATIGEVVAKAVEPVVGTADELDAAAEARRNPPQGKRRKGDPPTCKEVTGKTLVEWKQERGGTARMGAAIKAYAEEHGIRPTAIFFPDAKHPPGGDREHYTWRLDLASGQWRWDGPYTCLPCRDFGRSQRTNDTGQTLYLETPDGQTALWDDCAKCGPARQAKALAKRIAQAGISDAPAWTLDDIVVVAGLERIVEAARAWARGDFLQLFISGLTGRGKTHIAIGALRLAIEAGGLGYYINLARFLDELRSTYDDKNEKQFAEMMGLVQDLPWLVIDDLGAEKKTQWAQEKLFELADARWMHGLHTLTITNFEPIQLDDRVVGRLCQTDRTVVLRVPDTVAEWRLRKQPAAVA